VSRPLSFQAAAELILERARASGLTGVEVLATRSTATTVRANSGQVEQFEVSDASGIGVRAVVRGAVGHAYTENRTRDAVIRCLDEAVSNAGVADPREFVAIARHAEPPRVGSLYSEGLAGVSVERKIAAALAAERAAREHDPRIVNVPFAGYTDAEHHVMVANSAGLERTYQANLAHVYALALAAEGGLPRSGLEVASTQQFLDLDAAGVGRSAAERALAALGPRPLSTGRRTVVFDPRSAAMLLSAFAPVFSAQEVLDQRSPFRDRLGTSIGSTALTIVDDATLEGHPGARPFDAEGYPSVRTVLIEEGVLRTYLHDTETAARFGVTSTGHATRSIRTAVRIAPAALVIEPTVASREELLTGISDGVLVTNLMGLHSGLNLVTGEFSAQADGFAIAAGRIAHPVHSFTVSGILESLLGGVQSVSGDDLSDFSLYGTPVRTGSIRVESLSVAGSGHPGHRP
jgi:PmbA protein